MNALSNFRSTVRKDSSGNQLSDGGQYTISVTATDSAGNSVLNYTTVTGTLTLMDGSETTLDEPALLRPLEVGLKAFAWGVVALALGLAAMRLL